ncbi:hypothetical protein F4554_004557 [Actinopolymorpha rutila]|uniref:Uncharacterized protein n=1 Tax=Actinopolymorpha rutila TaxID=446787 RepID=A0A852ZR95_9ACTN|nr:hypothetical protein [Actinopolymorpha rutila]
MHNPIRYLWTKTWHRTTHGRYSRLGDAQPEKAPTARQAHACRSAMADPDQRSVDT